jgi:rRNA pseudouridine-1189 N-methylase Emg1 (Nep1/Mra1 family)
MINCGRPDLIHICLLQYHHAIKILSRLTNKIDFFIHTRDDKVFLVPQSWRVPVHFIRFRGLMEKFLLEGNLKLQDNERIFLKKKNLNELVNSLEPNLLVNLTETGLKDFNTFETLNTYLENDQKMVLLIGGFQKGDYDLQKILKRDITNVSLTGESTTAWMIISILMTGLLLNK